MAVLELRCIGIKLYWHKIVFLMTKLQRPRDFAAQVSFQWPDLSDLTWEKIFLRGMLSMTHCMTDIFSHRVQPQTSMGLEHSSSDVALLKRWSTAKDDLADILEDQSPDHDFKEADTQQVNLPTFLEYSILSNSNVSLHRKCASQSARSHEVSWRQQTSLESSCVHVRTMYRI